MARRRRKARRARKASGLTKRQRAARKAARKRKRKHAIRSRAARKANRTRKRRYGRGNKFGAAKESPKRRPRSRRRRHASEAAEVAEAPKRRRKRSRRRSRRHAAAPKGYRKSKRTGKYYKPRRRRARKSGGRKHRRRGRSKASYRRAARKGAQTRRLRKAKTSSIHGEYGHYVHERRRRRRHSHRHMARMPNPVSGAGEFGMAILGVLVGGLATVAADRFIGATHALTASTVAGTTATSLTDAPAQGQVYNSVGPSAPIWSSWKRLAAAAGAIVAPFVVAKMVKGQKAKSFFQLWGFSALTVTTVKAGTDAAAKYLGGQTLMSGLFPRLFAPEIDAQNALATVSATGAAALPAYTLVAGGTGPAPAPQATGNAMLGAPNGTECPPGYMMTEAGCVPNGDTPPPPASPPQAPPPQSLPPVSTGPGPGNPSPPVVVPGAPVMSVPNCDDACGDYPADMFAAPPYRKD